MKCHSIVLKKLYESNSLIVSFFGRMVCMSASCVLVVAHHAHHTGGMVTSILDLLS